MTAGTETDRVLWQHDLGDGEQLRVTVSEFRGVRYASIRRYWRNADGAWCPTKKGSTFALDLVAEIVAALKEAGAS